MNLLLCKQSIVSWYIVLLNKQTNFIYTVKLSNMLLVKKIRDKLSFKFRLLPFVFISGTAQTRVLLSIYF